MSDILPLINRILEIKQAVVILIASLLAASLFGVQPMIDKNTGTIRPEDCTETLYFGLTEQAFIESALGRQASVEMQNPPYSTYRVPLLVFDGRAWAAQLFFCYGILQLCSMALIYGNSWSDYSVETEYAQLKEYEDILMREVGAISYSAGWGHVGAYFSEKTEGSSIVVSYNVLLLIDR